MSPLIKHPKRRGEWVELQFMARAASHGLTVSKPWGDSARYDVVVEHRGTFSRVQVKSTCYWLKNGYLCHCANDGKAYGRDEIDFIAAYVIPVDIWYIVPFPQIIGNRFTICLAPERSDNKHFRYMEAWHLLRKGRTS